MCFFKKAALFGVPLKYAKALRNSHQKPTDFYKFKNP